MGNRTSASKWVALALCIMAYLHTICESKLGSQANNTKSPDSDDFELLGLGLLPRNGGLNSDSMENMNFLENSGLIDDKTTNLFKKYGMKPHMERREKRGEGVHFGYEGQDGPDKWCEKFPECNGHRQSPVNLVSHRCKTNRNLAIQWRGYNSTPRSMKITNNGHTVMVQGEWNEEDGGKPRIRMRHCHEEFVFEQLHFHWGCDNASGSEHTINKVRYPLELHVVFYRADLGCMTKAAETPGGLVVIGILFKLCDAGNKDFGKLLKEFTRIREGPITADITPIPLPTIIPLFSKHYYTYNGSLTTPPCSETVKWIVDKKQGILSSAQLQSFHHFMYEGKLIKKNCRPVQPLNGRVIEQVK